MVRARVIHNDHYGNNPQDREARSNNKKKLAFVRERFVSLPAALGTGDTQKQHQTHPEDAAKTATDPKSVDFEGA